MMALLVAAPSLPGMGEVEQGGAQRGPRCQARLGLALRGSGQLGPNGLPQCGAGHKRRRQGANDIGKATNGSSGEAGKAKMVELETTSAGDTTARRAEVKEDNSSENGGTGGSSDDSSNNGDASSAGRDKEIREGGKEGVLT